MTARLRGPAHPEEFRVNVGRARWYHDPLPAVPEFDVDTSPVPAVTTVKSAGPSGGLPYWYAEQAAIAAVDDRQAWAELERQAAIDHIKGAPNRVRDRAADRGSSLHDVIEARLLGQQIRDHMLGGDSVPYIPAIDKFLEEWQPELVQSEVVVFGATEHGGYGGTKDARLRLSGVGVADVDWKTRSATARNPHTVYETEAAQLGAYAGASYVIAQDDDGNAVRIANERPDVCLLFTCTPDGNYRLHPVDVAKAWTAWDRLYGWWAATRDLGVGRPLHVSAGPPRKPRPAPAPEAVETAWDDAGADPQRALAARIRGLDDAEREWLRERWPDACPTPLDVLSRGARWSDDDFARITALSAKCGPFDPPPAEPAARRPSAPVPTPMDDGPLVDSADVDLLVARAAEDAAVRAQVNAWIVEGNEADRPWNPRLQRHARQFEIARAAVSLAALGEDYARAALVAVIGDEEAQSHPVGALLGALTIDEAQAVERIAAAGLPLTFSDDGLPALVGVAALVAA
jgi:hypothetical protein